MKSKITAEELQSLKEEAKKYVSLEEFANKSERVFFHGTNNPEAIKAEGFSISEKAQEDSSYLGDNFVEGVHLSKNNSEYQEGGQLEDVREVLTVIISAKKILRTNLKGIGELYEKYKINELSSDASVKLTVALKKEGFEGLEYGNEVVIFDPQKVKYFSFLDLGKYNE